VCAEYSVQGFLRAPPVTDGAFLVFAHYARLWPPVMEGRRVMWENLWPDLAVYFVKGLLAGVLL